MSAVLSLDPCAPFKSKITMIAVALLLSSSTSVKVKQIVLDSAEQFLSSLCYCVDNYGAMHGNICSDIPDVASKRLERQIQPPDRPV